MKNKTLLVVIVSSLIVFIGCLTAGIIVAVNVVGVGDFNNADQFRTRLEELIEKNNLPKWLSRTVEDYTVDESIEMNLTGISNIRIVGVSEWLVVDSWDQDMVKGNLTGQYRSFSGPMEYIAEKQGSTLLIKVDYPNFGVVSSDFNHHVWIPSSYDGQVSLVEVSGNCQVNSQAVDAWSDLNVKTVSGKVSVDPAGFNRLVIETVSGDVEVEDCSADTRVKTVSGEIDISWITVADADFNTVSGDITVVLPPEAACEIKFKTVSGDFENPGMPIEITSDGNNRITGLLNGGGSTINAESVSGDLTVTTP